MEQWLFFGIALFAVIRITADQFARIFSFPGLHSNPPRLVLLTHNSQRNVEWVIRSYFQRTRLVGKPSEILCLDTGSTDDTPLILQRLKRRYPSLEVFPHTAAPTGWDGETEPELTEGGEALVLDLRNDPGSR
ncbi:hypothetical protein GCM10007416_18250 [Kroppenstedtia guangzhouensis]|jgi:hypothetical protein|uniref:Glycosyl transferase family 2 n=1 Tax=Kroppenstedtia guangzhouensis TaxID=1274356 RepID=A0ABQ1GLA1_9BACL|nr:glycosyltransferase [Kroppenstedtia guangzhouensis]GGA45467.1 hypothetical protein GCM10007416_18250 [Kroppenstedtia guangzhouensis]